MKREDMTIGDKLLEIEELIKEVQKDIGKGGSVEKPIASTRRAIAKTIVAWNKIFDLR